MSLNYSIETPKETVFKNIATYLQNNHLLVDKKDETRPWGGFFVIDEKEAEKFIEMYFPDFTKDQLNISGKLSPKILIVAPGQRLSWQYHHRRAEIWKLIGGTAGVITSDTDSEKEKTILKIGDIIQLKQGERHRLIGLNGWGIVAEIWQHTDAVNPSDEEDIIRVQDDFGR
jgi:mannose-6-phosphate isomerase-like protein (cupin superfamily)